MSGGTRPSDLDVRRLGPVLLRLTLCVLVWSAVLFVAVIGAAALLPSAASALSAAGLVVGLGVVLSGGFMVGWIRPRSVTAPPRRWPGTALILLLVALTSSATWLVPRVPPAAPVSHALPTSYLELPDGSRLALYRLGAGPQPPIVYVHGGPGIPTTVAEREALAILGSDREVVVYDQIGTGRSSRLADPRGYTMQRSVADLTAVVQSLDVAQVVLMGHSWGAQISTLYASRNPDRVAALIAAAPGQVVRAGQTAAAIGPQDRLGLAGRARVYGTAVQPRNLFGYALTAVNPRAAHALASDTEMDRRFSALLTASAPGLFCDPERMPSGMETDGLGFYASQIPQLYPDGTGLEVANVPAMRGIRMLVVRPECDYVPAAMTAEYATAFPWATTVPLPHSGHQLLLEQPGPFLEVVRDFLG